LLTVAHSYVVALNRRLAREMARAGAGRWEVTAVAPTFVHGDLRPIPLEPSPDDREYRLESARFRFSKRIHFATYGRQLRALLREPWDLVHCWEEPYVAAGAQVAWHTQRNIPFVFWTAQNISKRYPPPFSWMERYCLRRCSGWLACGRSIVDALTPRGYDRRPHIVAPLGVDLDVFRPDPAAARATRAALEWDEAGPPVVGYLGRFVPEKGFPLLTDALDRLAERGVGWRALLVGGGPLEESLRSWGKQHGDRVRVVTGVTHDGVPAHLAAMDVLACPSQTLPRWREQLGRMILEAFGCGVAVVGSDSGEIPHVIADAGRVVGEADTDGWVTALGELIESPARRAELAARGRDRAAAEYAWPVIARRHLDFFDSFAQKVPNHE
jgi:glycosyltransferase involved in cell wall biosynthesis